jgi:uncharacterized protein (TIGR02246 family)
MKLWMGAICLCISPATLAAQTTSAQGPTAVLKAMDQCWAAKDADCLASHVTDDLIYTNAAGMQWHSKAEARAGWKAMLAGPGAVFPTPDQIAEHFLNPDTAIVTETGWISGAKGPGGNDMPRLRTFLTAVLVKRDGVWLLASGHTSGVPARGP